MKNLFTLFILGSSSLLSAGHYEGSYNTGYGRSYNDRNYDTKGSYTQGDQRYTGNGYADQTNRRYYNENNYDNRAGSGYTGTSGSGTQYYRDFEIGYNENPNYTNASDQDIGKQIADTLEHGSGYFSKGFYNVDFRVNNGLVVLTGTVDTLENKKGIEDSLKKIVGIKQISNQITIAPENMNRSPSHSQTRNSGTEYTMDFAAGPSDQQLNVDIRNQLDNNWLAKNYEGLAIKTTNGNVVVFGMVDKAENRLYVATTFLCRSRHKSG